MHDKQYLVLSQKGSAFYTVNMEMENGTTEYRCTCLHFAFRKNMCKHIFASKVASGIEFVTPNAAEVSAGKKKLPPGRPRRQRSVKKRKFVN